jgi:RNase P/RNase MRP subunit POP5
VPAALSPLLTAFYNTNAALSPCARCLDWATLHQRAFGTGVLRCLRDGARRPLLALHPTRKAAEVRLAALAQARVPKQVRRTAGRVTATGAGSVARLTG